MHFFTAFSVLIYQLCVEAASDDNYVFYFRKTEFIDSGAIQRMLVDVDREIETLCRKMEVNCRFTKALEEYEHLQNVALGCATPQDRKTLEDAIPGFQKAREECVKKAECKNRLTEGVKKAVTSVKDIDNAANKEVLACGTDSDCVHNAYNNSHSNMISLYLMSRPELRLLADQDVASADCAGAIVSCMVTTNEAALRSVYEGTNQLRECQENAGVPIPAYTRRSVRVSEWGAL